MRYLTPVRIDETSRANKKRHAFAMIRQGIRDGAAATTPAEKLAALKKKKAGQARSSRAYWGAFSAKERAASKNERDPAKRQLASNLADWSKEKGQQAKGREKRVSDSIVPLTMDSLMETAREKMEKPRFGMIHNPPTPKLPRSISKPSPNDKKVKPSGKPFVKEDNDLLEVSKEKYDSMSGKERSDYAAKVSRRYRRMADAKKAKDKNFTPDKDLSRPLSAHREIKDRAYARAGRHAELKKLRARRKQPIRRAGMGGRDRGEEMAREAGDRP